jgi:hypothetical protein
MFETFTLDGLLEPRGAWTILKTKKNIHSGRDLKHDFSGVQAVY